MVRFIIINKKTKTKSIRRFTFQYGQIYYTDADNEVENGIRIYIPIWLDLLLWHDYLLRYKKEDLHSNMVRFIMMVRIAMSIENIIFTFQYGQIYYYRLILEVL